MKRCLLIVLLITASIFAQNPSQSYVSKINSSSTALGSSATFTGKSEDVSTYASIVVTVRSDKASASNGVKLQFSSNGTNWDNFAIKTYAANDTLTNNYIVPVKANYFRIIYTNTNSAQTYFRLQTIFSKNVIASDEVGISGLIANNSLTVSTETDSLTIVAPSGRYDFSYKSIDDTTEVAFTNVFTNPIRVFPSEGFTLKNISQTIFPKVFIRRKGGAGTCTYDYSYAAH